MANCTGTVFTPEEQARIDAEVKAYQERQREELIQTEIRNQICDAQRMQPGYHYG